MYEVAEKDAAGKLFNNKIIFNRKHELNLFSPIAIYVLE